MIAIIEDDKNIREMLEYSLKSLNWEVRTFENGIAFFKSKVKADLILLDLMLPKENGEDILKKIRLDSNVPVIILTAKNFEMDKIKLLNLGADDYVTKPFSIMELNARINALLRRSNIKPEKSILKFKNIIADENSFMATKDNVDLNLTKKEFLILVHLIKNKNNIVVRERLLEIAWGYEYIGESRTLDVHIASLRLKLNIDNIKTIRGIGYKLVEEND